MPGKSDYGYSAEPIGKYYPGSKEYHAWDEGFLRRYNDGGLSKPNTVHPVGSMLFNADQAGWEAANENYALTTRRMPWQFGSPP